MTLPQTASQAALGRVSALPTTSAVIPTPAPTQRTIQLVAATPQPTPAVAPIPSSKEALMQAAGIPRNEWSFVDCVINGCDGVSAEGGWNGTQRWNTTGSGAYGLCQSLPASKMAAAGADYLTNPITQLRWCSGHAAAYGGWAAAWNFRKCVGNCWSAAAQKTIYKTYTWW